MSRLVSMVLSAVIALGVAGCCGGRYEKPVVYEEPSKPTDVTAPTAHLDYNPIIENETLRLSVFCNDSKDRDKILLSNNEGKEIWESPIYLKEESSGLKDYSLSSDPPFYSTGWQDFRLSPSGNHYTREYIRLILESIDPGYHSFSLKCRDVEGNQSVEDTLDLYLYPNQAISASVVKDDNTPPTIDYEISINENGEVVFDSVVVLDSGSGVRSIKLIKNVGIDPIYEEIYSKHLTNRQTAVDVTHELPTVSFANGERGFINVEFSDYAMEEGRSWTNTIYVTSNFDIGDDDDSSL